ncbi:Autophagy protein 16 [Debaryomyces fabryi]|uniref:Autophagy protein 16 n=1 Tax=Debaryomyces fabryi TaxID=58627 RepID=A0A0V1PVM3_9ASCO|nr:Autophagy protein 16 [Debaryomyces fabryi]KSA00154.1 Autophagy protein 16 [Debaryomyces fabryi]CUM54508.1 unnamed protein product [Debaryomyces fabryi]
MSNEIEWSEDILNKLHVRDQYEKKDSKYFKAFSQLSQEARTNDQFSNSDKGIEHSKLLKENNHLKKENENLTNSLNQTTIHLEKSELKVNELLKSQDQLERQNKNLSNKIKHLNLEIIEKNKSVEILNDELLLNEIQTNVLNDRISKLSDENKKLVERWIEKVKSDAEKLNDANEFLERVNRK